jgi:hypothetical protein
MRDSAMIPATISDLQKGTQVPPEFYNTQPTIEDVQAFVATKFALDIETNRFTKQIICVGLCEKMGKAIVVPFQGAYIAEIRRIIIGAEEIIGHNLVQFDMPHLEEALGLVWKPE